MSTRTCPTCGRPIDEHNRHVRLVLPDPVLALPPEDRASRTWGSDPLIQVQDVGAFVRVLLPIRLTGGYSLTIGTWLAIDPARLRSVWEQWETPSYEAITLDGYLANKIPPWGADVLGAPCTAIVRDPSELPYLTVSTQTTLNAVLSQEWQHIDILEAYAAAL